MSELFLESPIKIVIGGIALTLMAGYGWIHSGRKEALFAAIGLFCTTLLLLLVGQIIETDREKVERTIYEIAKAVEANDHAKVFAAIHPSSGKTLQDAQQELPRYSFAVARVTALKQIEVEDKYKPPRATAQFNVRVEGEFQGMKGTGVRYVEVTFYKDGDQWKVYSYRHSEPTQLLRSTPMN